MENKPKKYKLNKTKKSPIIINTGEKKSSPKRKTIRIRKKKIDLKTPPIIIQNTIMAKPRMNEALIDIMDKLHTIMLKKGEPFKARAYKKAQETIMTFTVDITDVEQLRGKPGIGETIMEKLKEFSETGTLRLLEREKNNPENILSDVYGVGPKKAQELVKKGVGSIAELRARQEELLNDVQKVGLKYYEDILERIPRSEIDIYNTKFQAAIKKVAEEGTRYEIVGSYRRGAQASGDIDVIITSKNGEVFRKFVDELIQQKMILEVLSRGKSKCLVITKIPEGSHARRVDFLYTTPEEYPFSVLYFTGSKAFNTVMRGHALKKGFSLNEHGLSKMVDKKKEEKVDHVFTNEKDIFDYLGLQFKTPIERIDGRAVSGSGSGEPMVPPDAPSLNEGNKKEESVKVDRVVVPVADPVVAEPVIKLKKPKEPKEKKEPLTKKIRMPKKTDVFQDFKKNGISVLENLQQTDLEALITQANAAYYNKKPVLTDNEYDIIKEYAERKYPDSEVLRDIGAPIEKNKVKLPYEMASMDKIKPDTNALANWTAKYKGPYVLSCKLDGVSGMYTTEGPTPKLYTRGDGKVGQDVSHFLKVFNLPKEKGIVVRGEFIIPKAVFETKYKTQFANPRNLVAGVINSKTIDEKTRDIHFVTYEVIQPPMKPSAQMVKLRDLKHEVVRNQTVPTLSNEELSALLLDWRKNYEYEIDGVIVTNDEIYPRASGNPDHAFAFKMVITDQIAEAKVVDVIWNPSKNGYLKPRVRIEPIQLGGVTIEYATGFNGKFIEDNKIGIGALIEIIRSGDVIPYIKSVVTPAETAKMPDVAYVWTDTNVDVVLANVSEDTTVREKNITAFFVGLEVEGLSTGNVKRLMAAGFDSVPKILKMKKTDFAKVEGFKEKLTEKIYTSIHDKVEKADLVEVMAASNILGRGLGERKIRPIIDEFGTAVFTHYYDISEKHQIESLMTVKGIGKENAKTFVSNIPAFLEFMKECGLEYKLHDEPLANTIRPASPAAAVDNKNPLFGKKIVMTKIRDKEIIEYLKTVGATLEDGIKKDTFALIVKSKDDVSNKTKFAVENKIPIMTPAEFKAEYMK